jgi:hypothetical protein
MNMDHVAQAIVWFAGILLGVILSIFFEEPVHRVLARHLIRWVPRRARNLTGVWEAQYTYESNFQTLVEKQLIELRQVGKHVYGRTLRSQAHGHVAKGRFEYELYFTGIWENTTPGSIYHGSFQFILDPDGRHMTGKWLGFSESFKSVNHGDWTWRLVSNEVNDAKRLAASWQL